MPTTRDILAQLSRDELLALLDAYEFDSPDDRSTAHLVEVLAATPELQSEDILPTFPRTRLKALCRAFDLDDRGREKGGADRASRRSHPGPGAVACSRRRGTGPSSRAA